MTGRSERFWSRGSPVERGEFSEGKLNCQIVVGTIDVERCKDVV